MSCAPRMRSRPCERSSAIAEAAPDGAAEELEELRALERRAARALRRAASRRRASRAADRGSRSSTAGDAARRRSVAPARATNPAYVQLQAQLAGSALELESLVTRGAELRQQVSTFEETAAADAGRRTRLQRADSRSRKRACEASRVQHEAARSRLVGKPRDGFESRALHVDRAAASRRDDPSRRIGR